MRSVQPRLKDEGFVVPTTKLCKWFGVVRRTTCYKPTRAPAQAKQELAEPIKEMIEAEPSFGYRTVAALLRMNKSGSSSSRAGRCASAPLASGRGSRPRSRGPRMPDQRWATDLCRVWGGKDDWLSLALAIDCSARQLLGWHLSRTGKTSTASAALDQAFITCYGKLGRVREPFLLRSDNGLALTSREYTRLVRSYGLKQEFIIPHFLQQNGMVERVIRTLKEQSLHRHHFESQVHALRVIADWIAFQNQRRAH
ncbi:DDE-type integrase/transposase/recombinase [Stenotrophomonas sp. SbOxS2]|uniref:DDE-type integrase/transposase/recombinase n=1 Tax=Stenotrophomonas sp. SbOxS2 TaxID=2723885 RepID=UPI00211F074D|nr:DDE-type integrase/transposase/recombinase [Stenotrophomonas sp. SbOxS2]